MQHGLNALLPMDDRDTRKEVFYLMSKLTQGERLDFLRWCTTQVNAVWRGETIYVKDTTQGHVAETYADFAQMVVHYGLDPVKAAMELERRVRTIWLPPGVK